MDDRSVEIPALVLNWDGMKYQDNKTIVHFINSEKGLDTTTRVKHLNIYMIFI